MRTWLVAMLLVPLAGCFGGSDDEGPEVEPVDVGYDPSTVDVTEVRKETYTLTGFDGARLASVAYVPRSDDSLSGNSPTWPVVIFLHGWGVFKEQYEGFDALAPGASPDPSTGAPVEFTNLLDTFAQAGIIAIAYDARGHGQSTGMSTIAGPAEMADLSTIIDDAMDRFDVNGNVGLIGVSYGGGQALQAWADDARITTAVHMYSWSDLYDGLVTNNVPKSIWTAAEGALAITATKGQLHPEQAAWGQMLADRSNLESIREQMDLRSAADRMAGVDKPLLICQGLEESLFPQVHQTHMRAEGFTRSYVYHGGHNIMDEGCAERALDWMLFFTAGFNTGVSNWPELETADVLGSEPVTFAQWPETTPWIFHMREEDLVPERGENFTVTQNLASNPLAPPAVVQDVLTPTPSVPVNMIQDPTANFFSTAAISESAVVVGSPQLTLHLTDDAQENWQVAATLWHVRDNDARLVGRTAFASFDADSTNGTAQLTFPYTKVEVDAGDRFMLKIGANDLDMWMPLLANYAVTFNGASTFSLPIFEG